MDQITITDPVTGKNWTSGGRGKPPGFVVNHPKYLEWKANRQNLPSKPLIVANAAVTTSEYLNVYKWTGMPKSEIEANTQPKSYTRCVIVAATVADAMIVANHSFKNPMTALEMSTFWQLLTQQETAKLVEFMDLKKPGVYEFKNELGWVPRKVVG